MTEMTITALLTEARALLCAKALRSLMAGHRRRAGGLISAIDRQLSARQPGALSRATVLAAQSQRTEEWLTVDADEGHIAASATGVWIRAWLLLDWDSILPYLLEQLSPAYRAAVAALPPAEREIFLLHRLGGISLCDLARRSQCDVVQTQCVLARALATIARQLDRV